MSALLQIEDLETILFTGPEPVRVVDGVSLDIRRGETFALLGESGCGKSMTALSVMRLLPDVGEIVAGAVRMDGENLLDLEESAMRTVRGNRISMIFQEPMLSLNPVMTVAEQIGEVLERHTRLRGNALQQQIATLLHQVGIPDVTQRMNEYPFQFSGGMKQRVMIAIALAGEPDLLIADEPTTALDVTIQAQVIDLMRDLQGRTGMAILLITHDLGVVAEMAHRIAVMYAGQIVETTTRDRFFRQPAHPYSGKLLAALPTRARRDQGLAVIGGNVPSLSHTFTGCRFADRCDHAWELCRQSQPALITIDTDHAVRCHLFDPAVSRVSANVLQNAKTGKSRVAPGVPLAPASELLEVVDLKVHFPIYKGLFRRISGYVRAVDGVSMVIPQGKTLALVGESGCGKTTVGKGILQLIRVTSGSVRYSGQELVGLGREQLRQKRADLQFIFQDPYSSLNPRIRITDIIAEGMDALGVSGDKSAGRYQEKIETLLAQVGLPPDSRWRYPHEFSGGQRQRIAIARALAVNPQLLVCDEPTSALDVSVQAQILNLLNELQDSLQLTYLFITHNISVVEYMADEVAVMYLGRIVEQGGVDEILGDPKHPYTQALLSAVPVIDAESRQQIIRLQGDLPSPAKPPSGCHFHTRCQHVMPVCREHYPETTLLGETRKVRCHLYSPEPALPVACES